MPVRNEQVSIQREGVRTDGRVRTALWASNNCLVYFFFFLRVQGLKKKSANYRKVLEKIKITVASLLQPRARLRPWRRRWRAAAAALHDLGPRASPSGREVADRRPLRTYTIRLHRSRADSSSLLHGCRRRRIRRPAASDEGETAHGSSRELRARLRRKIAVRTP